MPDLSALLDTAFTRHSAGDLAEATRLYREILAQEPLQADALHMLGVIAKQQGNNELALKLVEVALGQRTTMPLAWHNRSLILRILGRKDEALQSAEQAVSLDPNFADAWDMAGFLLRDKQDLERSRACHARAVALQPGNMKFLGNYALLLLATGELAEAYKIMRIVEKRDPDFLPHTMGTILKAAGYTGRALPYFRKSRERLPGNDEVRATEAMAHLQAGDFKEGWKLWETRPSLGPRFQNLPFWQGQPIDHLLVHEDQGMGDALQCARYIPKLRGCAKRITIVVTKALHRLFAAAFADCEVLTLDDPAPAADARIRMLSLPAFFDADEKNTPASVPYLKTNKEWRHKWKAGLVDIPKPHIGLVWGGNPDHLNDRLRSIPFSSLQPLLWAGRGHIVSLQKGPQKNGIDLTAAGIFDADPFLGDFADTAGLLAELDLLISVDTSVVHLAGALGKPVWLMLPFDPDWRWLLGREDSPWYPTMRLFRQKEPRNWPEAVERAAADLRRLIAGDRSVLEPKRWNGACLAQNPQAIQLPET